MLVSSSHLEAAALRLVILAASLATTIFYFFSRQPVPFPVPNLNIPIIHGSNAKPPGFSNSIIPFWQDLALSLEGARPTCSPIGVEDGHPNDNYTRFEPLEPHKEGPERLNLTDENEVSLFRAHHLMRLSAQNLAPSLPFHDNKRGIVMTAAGKYIPIMMVSLRMLRRTECKLPVEVWLDSPSEYDATLCESVLPSLNARCRILSDIYEKAPQAVPPDHFQFKIFSILFSDFQHILFLDADAFPAHDPTPLFENPPYTTHGLVVWPDLFGNVVSSHFYHVAGIPEVPVSTRLSTESGQLMLDKAKHRESLIMMVYYNYFGPGYYYPLLCQGSHGAGDKETFIAAAMVTDTPFYQLKTNIDLVGHHNKEDFIFVAIGQFDPIADFNYVRPQPNHIHTSKNWEDKDLPSQDLEVNSTKTSLRKPLQRPSEPLLFFVHNNMHKLDPSLVLNNNKLVRNDEGNYNRIYGEEKGTLKRFGYDIERRLWEVIAEEGCRVGETLCNELRNFYAEVFGLGSSTGTGEMV